MKPILKTSIVFVSTILMLQSYGDEQKSQLTPQARAQAKRASRLGRLGQNSQRRLTRQAQFNPVTRNSNPDRTTRKNPPHAITAQKQSQQAAAQVRRVADAYRRQASQNRAAMQAAAVRRQMNLMNSAFRRQASINWGAVQSAALRRQMKTMTNAYRKAASRPPGLLGR